MGTGFRRVRRSKIPRDKTYEEVKKSETRLQKAPRTLSIPYPIYLIYRIMITILWVIKITYINLGSPITLIHAQDTGYAGLAAVLSKKLLGIPAVVSAHGIRHKTQESNIHGKLKGILLKIEYSVDMYSVKNADNIIADNGSIREYFEKRVAKKIDVIPIPIRLSDFEFSELNRNIMRKEMGIDKSTIVIGYVGRFSSEKNLLTLLSSFADAATEVHTIKLVLVGGGPLESDLREYVGKRRLNDKVVFCGIRHDIDRILPTFDIFVLPSYTEGLSIALLEAMTSSRAIICSDIPTNRELIRHLQEGLVVDPYNLEQIKDCIVLLSRDEALRSRLGNNARIKVSQYDEDRVFPTFIQYYKKLSNK